MAAKFNPSELKDLLECSICLNRFTDPRVLPCLHSYCLECLEEHVSANKDKDGSFACPQCRETCLLPDGGAEKYPKNFFVNTMKDVLPASILQEPTPDASDSPGPIMCKHHTEQSEDEHGEATTFCVQCDAHFCQHCTKSHGMFTKDHEVTPVGEQQHGADTKQDLNCNLHPSIPINWYCKTCSLPVCSECLIENHKYHDSDKLVSVEAALKLDMLDVSQMAAKRLQHLQKLSAEVKENETKMEDELDKVSKEISETADGLCKLIRKHEATLQGKVKEAREEAMKQFKEAEEELQRAEKNTSSLQSRAESLHQASSEQALSTVVRAELTKQQHRHQEGIIMPSARWSLQKQGSQPGKLAEFTFLGDVDFSLKKSSEMKRTFQSGDYLGEPVRVVQLEYKGNKGVCAITPIYKSRVCVTHFREETLWVYSDSGKLQQKLKIPEIGGITGMVAVDEKTGKLALVDDTQCKLHLVTLTTNLAVQRHSTEKIAIKPYRISLYNNQLVLSSKTATRVIVLNFDGQILSDINLSIPLQSLAIYATQQTKSGFVVCDKGNKKVYFTDTKGHLLQTSADCASPWHVVQTSSGHILVVDSGAGEIKVFSEAGKLLGSLDIPSPYFVTISDERSCLYIGCCCFNTKHEMRTYKLAASSNFPLLGVTCNITDIEVAVKLTEY